jgi:hypothetical protein
MRGTRRSSRRFLSLFTNVKRSRAYHGLSCVARALLFEVIDRFNGCNNGMIGLGCREASHELNCGKSTAARAMHELDDAGLARPTKVGAWRGKQATEWRLMFLRCDKTGELPATQWEQRTPYSESHQKDTKVPPQVHRESLSPATGTQTPNSSMNEEGPSPATGTHIDIYQGGRGCGEGTEPDAATPLGTLPEGLKEGEKNFGPSVDERISSLKAMEAKRRAAELTEGST